jgi:hypothetical protein
MMRQRRVLLLGTALGAALLSAPLPVAGAAVPDLDPSPSRVVVRDPVRDIINGGGTVARKRLPTINLTRLAVTYGTHALRIRGFFVNLRPVTTQGVLTHDVHYDIGTPSIGINGEWTVTTRGQRWGVEVGFEQPPCWRARARWAYRKDFVNVRVPWRCLAGVGTRTPRSVIVEGRSSFTNRPYSDYVPGRPDLFSVTPPVLRPPA